MTVSMVWPKFEQVWKPDSSRFISYANNKNVHVSMKPYYYLIHVSFQKQVIPVGAVVDCFTR